MDYWEYSTGRGRGEDRYRFTCGARPLEGKRSASEGPRRSRSCCSRPAAGVSRVPGKSLALLIHSFLLRPIPSQLQRRAPMAKPDSSDRGEGPSKRRKSSTSTASRVNPDLLADHSLSVLPQSSQQRQRRKVAGACGAERWQGQDKVQWPSKVGAPWITQQAAR